MSEHAIPGLKFRRKRPLSPTGRLALLNLSISTIGLICAFVSMVSDESWRMVSLVMAIANSLFIRYWLPILIREIRRMHD